MALTPRAVFTRCVDVRRDYETSVIGPDAHLVQFLAAHKVQNPSDVSFITDVFLGCIRFKKMLAVTVDGYYVKDGENCSKKYEWLFHVIAYMGIIIVDDIGAAPLETMLMELPRVSMSKAAAFIAFLWNGDAFETWVQERWRLLYDDVYVDNQLLGPVRRHVASIQEIYANLHSKLTSKTVAPPAKAPTTPQPFNLSKPRVKKPAEPARAVAPPVTKPIPATTYATPIEQKALERKRRMNRAKAEQTRQTSNALPTASLATKALSERTLQLQETMRQREAEHLNVTIKARPVPAALNRPVDVKLNAGAILREERLLRAEREREEARLASVAAGAFDTVALHERALEMHALEEKERHDAIEIKHLQGLISREDAVLARAKQGTTNRRSARELKRETEELLQKRALEKREEHETNRQNVMDVADMHERTQQAVLDTVEAKALVRKGVAQESKALLEHAAKMQEQEAAKRAEVIRQIRALESVPIDRTKIVDKSATSGCGLMTEMSYIELQERLAMLRVRNQREEEQRRDKIVRSRVQAEQTLKDKVSAIARARVVRSQVPNMAERIRANKSAVGNFHNSRVDELRAKLAAKRTTVQKITSK
eukprot:m.980284 g.980284  ORF g.980284 m.980284 type:complete len:599 (-) comp23964_c1_seq12:2815-4611(-)